jgi:hypothetical protein
MTKQIKQNKKNQKLANKQRIMRSKQIPTKKTSENKEHNQTQKNKELIKAEGGGLRSSNFLCVFLLCLPMGSSIFVFFSQQQPDPSSFVRSRRLQAIGRNLQAQHHYSTTHSGGKNQETPHASQSCLSSACYPEQSPPLRSPWPSTHPQLAAPPYCGTDVD